MKLQITGFLTLPLLLLSVGCTTIQVNRTDVDCLKFVPEKVKLRVGSAPVPMVTLTIEEEVKSWQKFGVAQTGQLNKSEDDKETILFVVKTCQDEFKQAVPRKKFLGVF